MSSPTQYFRAGTGAVIVNAGGLVLACERADFPGAWQLPQGGLEDSEEPLQGAFREIAEETGISKGSLELLDTYPEPLVYELPASRRSEKTGRGQVQYWFLFRFSGTDSGIDVNKSREFRAWQWMPFDNLLKVVADMRKPVYCRLAVRFQRYFSSPGTADSQNDLPSGAID
jgi:putative (di)nucleoside polyphosphate hydrolase